MTPRRIGNPSRVPPFPGEVRALLGLLVGRQPGEDAEPWLYGMVGVGWIESARRGVAITEAGREALARELLRSFTGPVVVVEDPAWIVFHDEAAFLLALFCGRDPSVGREPGHAGIMRHFCRSHRWIDAGDRMTDAGRAALASWLLRGWRP